jgi:hypothetical protein
VAYGAIMMFVFDCVGDVVFVLLPVYENTMLLVYAQKSVSVTSAMDLDKGVIWLQAQPLFKVKLISFFGT